jgi:hypothetical protein
LASKKTVFLSDLEKQALVYLHQNGTDSTVLSKVFGLSTGSIAAFVANATRGAYGKVVGSRGGTAKRGVLPSSKWMKENGYRGLYAAMLDRPEPFSHIPQGTRHRSAAEWVPVAETLASENGGTVLGHAWLAKNGYLGMAAAMRKRPELFSHIPKTA